MSNVQNRRSKGKKVLAAMRQGHVLVPSEATREMMDAGVDAAREAPPPETGPQPGYVQIRAAWDAMIKVAQHATHKTADGA